MFSNSLFILAESKIPDAKPPTVQAILKGVAKGAAAIDGIVRINAAIAVPQATSAAPSEFFAPTLSNASDAKSLLLLNTPFPDVTNI